MMKFSISKISHPIWMFFLALFVLTFSANKVKAQSEVWAGGEIVLEYVDGTCEGTDSIAYDVIFKFYRDDVGTAAGFINEYIVGIYSPVNGIPITAATAHTVELIPNSSHGVQQYCLNGNPVATEGAWYRSKKPHKIAATDQGDWFFAFIGRYGGDYRSPEDRNIQLGQQLWIETRFNLKCGMVPGTTYNSATNTYDPDTIYNPAPAFKPTEYVDVDPVASFCVGKEYEFNLKSILGEGFSKVEYDIAPIWRGKNQLAAYLVGEGYSINNPFPTTNGIEDSDLERRGILRFTAQKPFAGPVPFFVKNFTSIMDTVAGDVNKEIVPVNHLTVMSQREYRFIFDLNCNSRLPNFVGGVYREANPGLGDLQFFDTYNATEDAYEYNCAGNELVFQLSEPVLIESLGIPSISFNQQDQGFRFSSESIGDSTSFLDDIPVERVDAIDTVNVDETSLLRVTLSRKIGPGRYILYMKKGDDLNTLVNRCESTIPEYERLATIYVNDTYVYNHKEDQYTYCFPAGDPPEARISANYDGNIDPPYYVGWKYFGGGRFFPPGSPGNSIVDDTTFMDTMYLGPRRFKVDKPKDSNWVNSKINIGAGWWRVGFGYDFSTYDASNGQLIESRVCYGEDEFYVDTVTVEELEIPDFDLCPDEDLPVIDLSSYAGDIIQNSFQWGKWDGTTYKNFYSQYADPSFAPPNNVKDSLGKAYNDVSTKSYIFDTRGAFSGVGDTNFFRALFRMRGKYLTNRTCPVQVEFKVLKQLVEIELNEPEDSVICEGEQYLLRNIKVKDYFIPEQYSYQWYLDNTALPNDTTDSLRITTTGMYKLEVIKTTDSSICNAFDSVFVRISNYLDAPSPECAKITFTNAQIEQLFSWNVVPGANDYQARIVLEADKSGSNENEYGPWEYANDLYGINHRTVGPRLGLEVRAVNLGVAETADCRYSEPAFAKACEALVKPTNVFTPNGDGINDFLKFDLVEVYPGSKLKIFNRWGKILYEDNDYFNDWDGEDYKEGTYFYVLDINDPNQEIIKGTFTIIRD